MATPHRHTRYTYAEYLSLEEDANTKHEYLGGQILAMAGGTPDHAAMAMNIGAALLPQLRERGRVYSSDLRVRVLATGLATYPDVTVVCGEPRPDPESKLTIVNPTLVVEVTSKNTSDYDRGEKLENYQQIPELQVIVIVAHDERRLEVWTRGSDGWHRAEHTHGPVALAIGATLVMDDVYRGTSVP